MHKAAYKLRISDCIIPAKGVTNYMQRIENAGRNDEPLRGQYWEDVKRFSVLMTSQTMVISLPIIAVAKGIEALLN